MIGQRAGTVFGLQIAAAVAGWQWPFASVLVVALTTAVGAWALARPEPREARRSWAIQVGIFDGIAVCIGWFALASLDPGLGTHPLGVRAGLSASLGVGAGFAGAVLCLVGADARGAAVDG